MRVREVFYYIGRLTLYAVFAAIPIAIAVIFLRGISGAHLLSNLFFLVIIAALTFFLAAVIYLDIRVGASYAHILTIVYPIALIVRSPALAAAVVAANLLFAVYLIRQYQFINNIPSTTPNAAPMGRLVEVVGEAVPPREEDTAQNREYCYRDVTVYRHRHLAGLWPGGSGNEAWESIAAEPKHPSFLRLQNPDTQEGDLLRVDLRPAALDIQVQEEEYWGTENMPDRWRQLLSSEDIGTNDHLRVEEKMIAPGETVYGIGAVEEDADGKKVLTRDEEHGIFVITDKEEPELRRNLRWRFSAHIAAAFIGVLLFVLLLTA